MEKKALATSIAFVGSNIGGVIFTPVVSRLIEQQGWRFSFQVSAVVVLVSVIVVSILVRKFPASGPRTTAPSMVWPTSASWRAA